MNSVHLSCVVAAILCGACGADADEVTNVATHVSPPDSNPRLEGYCPVALSLNGELESGSEEHQARFGEDVFQMTNARSEAMFVAEPERFVPPFDGNDPVLYQAAGGRSQGRTELFVVHLERAWFFVREENRRAFMTDPDRYIRDLPSEQ